VVFIQAMIARLVLARSEERKACLRRSQKLLQQLRKRIAVSKLAHQALDALRARTS
jgi:hypothetical protein